MEDEEPRIVLEQCWFKRVNLECSHRTFQERFDFACRLRDARAGSTREWWRRRKQPHLRAHPKSLCVDTCNVSKLTICNLRKGSRTARKRAT